MKIRLLAVILAVFAFCGIASAQTYFIRVEGRNNLRSCAGFNCRVVETAPVGTVLEVVGEYNRWLKINHNGEEVWMANWIDYTRVDPSQSKHPGVIIEGSEDFITWVEAALDLLKDNAPEWYDYVISGLDKIEMIPAVQRSGILIDTRTYVKASAHNFVTTFRRVVQLAGGMVHEACHVHLWYSGFRETGWRNELPCVQMQLEVTEALDPFDRASLGSWLRYLIENIENPEYWWW